MTYRSKYGWSWQVSVDGWQAALITEKSSPAWVLTPKLQPCSSLHTCRGFYTQQDRLSPTGHPVTQLLPIAGAYSLHNLGEPWFPGHVRFIHSLSLMSLPCRRSRRKLLHSTPPLHLALPSFLLSSLALFLESCREWWRCLYMAKH